MQCFKCKADMKVVKLIGDVTGMPVYIANKKKGILNPETRSNVECFVCPQCGYIELKAEQPDLFTK